MDASAATAAVAHKRVKRALGLLRQAAAGLAPELADVEVLGELHLEAGDDAARVLELVRIARQHRRAIDVVVVSSTPVDDRGRERQPSETSPRGTPHHSRHERQRSETDGTTR